MKNIYIKLFIFATVTLFSTSIFGQTKTGTTLAQFLKLEPSARLSVMNSSAVSGELSAIFNNPASLARLDGYEAQFTHSPWLAGISFNYLVVGIPVTETIVTALHLTSMNSGEIDVRTVEQPLGTGERYDATSFALGLTAAAKVTNRVVVGLEVNYIQERIWHSSYNAFTVDLGVQYEIFENGPVLGASLSNFGPRSGYSGRDFYIDYDFDEDKYGDNDQIPAELRTGDYPLPTLFRVGIAYPININENNNIEFVVDALHPNDNTESVHTGLEWNVAKYLSLRGGYRNLFQKDLQGGLVAGVGLNFGWLNYTIKFDYSWADYGVLNAAQRFTLGFEF